MSLNELSSDELLHIFEFLKTNDKLIFGNVSKYLYKVSLDNLLWKNIYQPYWNPKVEELHQRAKENEIDIVKKYFSEEKCVKESYTNFMVKNSNFIDLKESTFGMTYLWRSILISSIVIFLIFLLLIITFFISILICYSVDFKSPELTFILVSMSLVKSIVLFLYIVLITFVSKNYRFYLYDYLISTQYIHLNFKPFYYKTTHYQLQSLSFFYIIIIFCFKYLLPDSKMIFMIIPLLFIIIFNSICVYLERTRYQVLKMISYYIFYLCIISGMILLSINIDNQKEIIPWFIITSLFYFSTLIFTISICFFEISTFLIIKEIYHIIYAATFFTNILNSTILYLLLMVHFNFFQLRLGIIFIPIYLFFLIHIFLFIGYMIIFISFRKVFLTIDSSIISNKPIKSNDK